MELDQPVIAFNKIRGIVRGSCLLYDQPYYIVELDHGVIAEEKKLYIRFLPIHAKNLKPDDIPSLANHLIECV